MKYLLGTLAMLVMTVHPVAAQPAATSAPLAEQPAVKSASDSAGTTVVGDRESPIGLYITPWRNATPEAELDRPARFLEEELQPLDPDVFRRQIEYYNTITDHLRAKSKPVSAPATTQ